MLIAQVKIDYKYKKTKSGLQYKILKKGLGNRIQKSQKVFISYSFFHKRDTSKIIKSIVLNSKKEFLLGHEEVLKGWDEGFALLKEGDSAVFKIPPHLAYGDKKFGSIAPNSTLFLFTKVDSIKDVFFNHNNKDTTFFTSGLKKIKVKSGKGRKAQPFQEVLIRFNGYVYSLKGYKQLFESSSDNKKNMLFQLGIGKFVKGLDEGILTMEVGEKSTFIVPPHLGYGNKQTGKILPNTTLLYDIELIDAINPFFDFKSKKGCLTEDSVKLFIVEENNGELISKENIVVFDYKAYYKNKDGYSVLFDNSFQLQRPIMQRPGSGKGFPGIENALLKLKKGEKATAIIPEKLILNKNNLNFIKSGDSVYFDIYIQDVFNYQFMYVSSKDTIKSKNGLAYIDAVNGDGQEIKKGDKINVAYSIYFIDNYGHRNILDASREREKWLELEVGAGKNIPGFEEGVIGIKEGGMRRIIIPPSLAYGKEGLPERGLPPNKDLIVDIEGVRKLK
jgi:peptidylprolyl isomerase